MVTPGAKKEPALVFSISLKPLPAHFNPRSPRQAHTSVLSHVWHFGRLGIRAFGTQHAKNILCHVNLCKALVEVAPRLPRKSLLASSTLGSSLLSGSLVTLDLDTHHPGPQSHLPQDHFCLILWHFSSAFSWLLKKRFRERMCISWEQVPTHPRWRSGHQRLPGYTLVICHM